MDWYYYYVVPVFLLLDGVLGYPFCLLVGTGTTVQDGQEGIPRLSWGMQSELPPTAAMLQGATMTREAIVSRITFLEARIAASSTQCLDDDIELLNLTTTLDDMDQPAAGPALGLNPYGQQFCPNCGRMNCDLECEG